MPKRNKPHARSRARAATALQMRLGGRTNAGIAAALHYASESGARMAVDRELNRRTVAGVDTLRREHGERLLTLLRSCWGKATAGDDAAIRTAARLLDSISRLYGLDAAMQLDVRAGISADQFAEQAAGLICVINGVEGPGTRAAQVLAESVPGVAKALLPSERVDLFGPTPATEAEDDEPWSNIGGPGIDDESPAVFETNISAGAPTVDDDQDDDAEEIEAEIVEPEPNEAVVVALACQKCIPAGQVLDENGVPWSRTGIAQRLGGYDPLRGWRPGWRP